jgi:hypothetical protein
VGAILPYFSLEAAVACQFEDDTLTISSFFAAFYRGNAAPGTEKMTRSKQY